MRRVLVFQHVAHEILGTLNPLLKAEGFRIKYINFGRDPGLAPNLKGYHGLIVLGGPMNVDEDREHPHLKTELSIIAEAIEKDIPVLGICLGAQLLAKALGARVERGVKEIGWVEVRTTEKGKQDQILGCLCESEKVFQWHGDMFSLPRGAEHLASSQVCPYQAFRYGKKAYGFQFHLEVDQLMIERWLRIPRNKAELEAIHGDAEQIVRDTTANMSRSLTLSDKVFGKFVELFPSKDEKILLSSGHRE